RETASQKAPERYQISLFFHPQCPHCRAEKAFIPSLQAKYPQLSWQLYDTSSPENNRLLHLFIQRSHQPELSAAVPMTFIGSRVIIGFDRPETTGVQLEQAIRALLAGLPSDPAHDSASGSFASLTLPILGTIHPMEHSLPVLTVILGLADGFNPCAMWVLVYLISLIVSLDDRRKIWLLVGTFVASSGILYFLFMTAWLNVFLFLGFLRPLTLVVGLGALGAGILNIREYIQTKGQVVCHLGNADSRQRTMHRIDRIVDAPLTFFTVLAVIVLAFIVNSIEFACSAALPAVYTHALSLHRLPTFAYYGYILLYTFFFMLDDLIIFSLAVLALDTNIGQRYAGHCRIIGGIVLLVLGMAMTFRPDLLR
ncbi:MAG: glutaredoxin family protein, partial [Desulfobulbus sp.]